VIAVAARWSEPEARKGSLRPYAERAEAETLRLLDASLIAPESAGVSADVRKKLAATAAADAQDLIPHLQERARETAARAERLLAERGKREAGEMAQILDAQRTRIDAQRRIQDPDQLRLFADEERRQLEADRRHWEKRLGEIAVERDREPERILASYAVKATRVEPVGLVYLWPVSG
jgi:hypothetical protein